MTNGNLLFSKAHENITGFIFQIDNKFVTKL